MAVKAQFIAGQWLPGSGATMSKLAPEDQSLLWQAASAGADDVQAACAAARAAFYPWSHRPLAERIDVVQRFAALLETHKEALATLISRETSKPLWETRTEVQAMIGKAAISIEAYHQRTGFHESTLPDGKALLRHKPHGVMAVFGPYNFPGHLPNGHIIPALIAGNTIVFKPSELTPATAEMTVQLWQQAGIPDGAINLLQGGKATGQALLVALISAAMYGVFLLIQTKTHQSLFVYEHEDDGDDDDPHHGKPSAHSSKWHTAWLLVHLVAVIAVTKMNANPDRKSVV